MRKCFERGTTRCRRHLGSGRSNSAQVGTEYKRGPLCVCVRGSSAEIQTGTHRNLTDYSKTNCQTVSSPSSILPPPSSHCAFSTYLFHVLTSFLISNFRRVMNVVNLFWMIPWGSEFYVQTFRNTLYVTGGVDRHRLRRWNRVFRNVCT